MVQRVRGEGLPLSGGMWSRSRLYMEKNRQVMGIEECWRQANSATSANVIKAKCYLMKKQELFHGNGEPISTPRRTS